jgi:hypothetical protein
VPRRFVTEVFDITVDNGPEVAHLYTTYRGEPRETRGSHRNVLYNYTKHAMHTPTNLDTMEYSPGFHETRQPFSTPGRSFQDILEGAADRCLYGGHIPYVVKVLMARDM